MHALSGDLSPKSMKVEGNVNGKRVMVLVDSGSTHNFINQKLAKKLNCPMSRIPAFKVYVANRNQLECDEVCKQVKVHLQKQNLKIDLYPLQMKGIDIVLGVNWLETLEDVICNWKKMIMKFQVDGKEVVLQGLQSGHAQPATLQSLVKLDQTENSFYLVQWKGKETEEGRQEGAIGSWLPQLLQEYGDVFEEGRGRLLRIRTEQAISKRVRSPEDVMKDLGYVKLSKGAGSSISVRATPVMSNPAAASGYDHSFIHSYCWVRF